MLAQELHLDPAIRDWVLGGLSLILLLSGLIRHYVTKILSINPPKAQTLLEIREQRALARGGLLRSNGSYLSPAAFVSLKTHLSSAYKSGYYLKSPPPAEGESPAPPPNPLDPNAMDGMMDMLKKQAVSFLPQTVLMYYIGYFYDGFLLTRLPFPLTPRFKTMLQRGIQTADMDVSWVSSVSWYFLCLFGLNSLYRLILGEDNAADGGQMAAMNQMGGAMMGGGAPMPGQPAQDYVKLYKTERENLDIVEYSWVCDGVEDRLLRRWN